MALTDTNNITLDVGLSALQLHLYQSIINRDLDIINDKTDANKSALLGTVMQLLQCCSHPSLFDEVEEEQHKNHQSLHPEITTTHHLITNCGKFFVLDKLITKIMSEQSNKILICSSNKDMFEWFEEYCNYRGIAHFTIEESDKIKTKEINSKCSIILHHTSNQDGLKVIDEFPGVISTLILYDTHWNVKDAEEEIIKRLEDKCNREHRLNVYRSRAKDTLEEKVFGMDQKKELNEKELRSLIEYNADKILDMNEKSTLNMEQSIEDILKNAICDDDNDEKNDTTETEEVQKKYTMRDILNHPENQGVIRVFVFVFIAMIVIPILTVIYLNKYVMEYYILDWSDTGKENVTIVIGVAIAHVIGLMYVCYAWSGEDRIPAHILDADNNEKETTKEEETNENDASPTSDSSEDRKKYIFIERQDPSKKGLRKRKNKHQHKQ